jgi:3-methyladenine DNA glycosylase AlkD
MGRDNLIERLRGEAEEQYRIFNQKFVLTNRNLMLGVKVPKMRSIAREIAAGDWEGFLAGYGFGVGNAVQMAEIAEQPNRDERCRTIFFEEVMIIGMVIDLINVPPSVRLVLVAQFVPLIDNWAVCDVFCGGAKWVGEPGRGPKACNRVPLDQVWEFLQRYLFGSASEPASGCSEFEIRFGVVMLMSYFLVPEYVGKVFEVLARVRKGDYYVDMAVAWCLATARVKFDAQTQAFVAGAGLPAGVLKKYEQKVRDSLIMRKRGSSR